MVPVLPFLGCLDFLEQGISLVIWVFPWVPGCFSPVPLWVSPLDTSKFRKCGNAAIRNRTPKKARRFLLLQVWAPSTCSCCLKGKKHGDLEFAISKRSDVRFHSAIFLRFFGGTCGKSAICNLRFENEAICDASFWDAKLRLKVPLN